MPEAIRGVVRGKTIELLTEVNFVDGQEVEMTIRPVAEPDARVAAMMRTFGAMADDPEFDEIMAKIERDRRTTTDRVRPG